MIKKKISKIFLTFNSLMLLAPAAALAQTGGSPYVVPETNLSIERVYQLFVSIMNWIFAFAIVLSVILIIVGGISYMTAGGDDTKTTAARKKIIYGLIGIAVVIAAWGLIQLIARFLGVNLPRPT